MPSTRCSRICSSCTATRRAYGVAGLAAAIVAGAQIVGGLAVPLLRRVFSRRTDVLILAGVVSVVALALIGWTSSFWVAIALLVVWAIAFSAAAPMRQAYLNGLIPSEQRATVLSFDALMASSGGVVAQPGLGRVADVWGYSASYAVGAVISVAAIPFLRWPAASGRRAIPSPRLTSGNHTDT